MYKSHLLLLTIPFMVLLQVGICKKSEVKPDWAKKDIRDYSDADMERLLDQWEVTSQINRVLVCFELNFYNNNIF